MTTFVSATNYQTCRKLSRQIVDLCDYSWSLPFYSLLLTNFQPVYQNHHWKFVNISLISVSHIIPTYHHVPIAWLVTTVGNTHFRWKCLANQISNQQKHNQGPSLTTTSPTFGLQPPSLSDSHTQRGSLRCRTAVEEAHPPKLSLVELWSIMVDDMICS